MNNFNDVTFKDGDFSLKVAIKDNTGWLSQSQIANLFGVSQPTISRKIKSTYNILKESMNNNDSLLCKIEYLRPLDNQNAKKVVVHYSLEFIEELNKLFHSDLASKCFDYIRSQLSAPKCGEARNDIVIFDDGEISINVNISKEEETVWLTQGQIATLFDSSQPNISMHISNILSEGELDDSVHKDFLYTASDNKQYLTTFYNLDLILAVGYRTKGKRAIEFRKWVTKIMRQFIIDGYALNDNRISLQSDRLIEIESEIQKIKNDNEKLKADILKGNIKEKLFFDGQMFDAYEYLCELIRRANSSIRIIDPYFDDRGLSIISKSRPVKRKIYLSHPSFLRKEEIEMFRHEFGNLEINKTYNYHDRFIILDDTECYLVGTSLNKAGSKTFAVIRLESQDIITSLIKSLDRWKKEGDAFLCF